MELLTIKTTKLTPGVLAILEKKKLVRRLAPTRKVIATRTKTGAVETFYSSSPLYGTHKLIAVGKRTETIRLTVHPDNEDFILLNPARLAFKPLYIVVGLATPSVLAKKAEQGRLRPADFLAVEVCYDDPATCVFTMLKGTPHCEVTVPGSGQHPVFFVTEPSKLRQRPLALRGYTLVL
jgi:hypothetical protein